MSHLIAAIRIRGTAGVNPDTRTTLRLLRLFKSNHLVLLKDDKSMRNMAVKVKDRITYGEIDDHTLEALLEKRGRVEGNKRLTPEVMKENNIPAFAELAKEIMGGKRKLGDYNIEPVFRLNPPKKGHERKGIKKPYAVGGALGNRGKGINELIMRMV